VELTVIGGIRVHETCAALIVRPFGAPPQAWLILSAPRNITVNAE